MFYEKQDESYKKNYKTFLQIIGQLSRLFSESDDPYLPYRIHENLFSLCFNATNLARKDCSADAMTADKLGVGLKTWVSGDDQKVAEFGKLLPKYKNLTGKNLIENIADYRNKRIQTTINTYGLQDQLIYHIVKRIPGYMVIYECPFDKIDIDNITILESKNKSENNIHFTDGKHTYHFSRSKNTLYMKFDNMKELDRIPIDIIEDPYSYLLKLINGTDMEQKLAKQITKIQPKKAQLCLRLYSHNKKDGNFVATKSGLNQWNGSRKTYEKLPDGTKRCIRETPRDPLEVYIPYPVEDRVRSEGFFPPKDVPFQLHLPDEKVIRAKLCQDGSKAIMSCPNKDLGQWLLRQVFALPEKKVLTYDMLLEYGVDCVVFTKNSENDYSIDFAPCGTYEEMLETE